MVYGVWSLYGSLILVSINRVLLDYSPLSSRLVVVFCGSFCLMTKDVSGGAYSCMAPKA